MLFCCSKCFNTISSNRLFLLSLLVDVKNKKQSKSSDVKDRHPKSKNSTKSYVAKEHSSPGHPSKSSNIESSFRLPPQKHFLIVTKDVSARKDVANASGPMFVSVRETQEIHKTSVNTSQRAEFVSNRVVMEKNVMNLPGKFI